MHGKDGPRIDVSFHGQLAGRAGVQRSLHDEGTLPAPGTPRKWRKSQTASSPPPRSMTPAPETAPDQPWTVTPDAHLAMAISNLLAEAMKESPTPFLQDDVDVEHLPFLVANSHLHAYGDDGCSDKPCRLAGLCLALLELLNHRAESRLHAELRALQATEVARKRIKDTVREYVAALDALVACDAEKHRVAELVGAKRSRHNHELVYERPQQIKSYLIDQLEVLQRFEDDLRELFWSPELYQRFDKPRADYALRAAMQHLKWTGDLSYREIGQLMISGKGTVETKQRRAYDIIRAKGSPVKDARSVFACDDLARVAPSDLVDASDEGGPAPTGGAPSA